MPPQAPVILYAEDSEDAVFLLRRAISRAKLVVGLVPVSDGLQAMYYLAGTGHYADRRAYPPPNLILLDINMPNLSGLETLARIRARQEWDVIPVVMLSTSDDESDVDTAYASGADSYVVKPGDMAALGDFAKDLLATCASGEPRAHLAPLRRAIPAPRLIRK